MKDRQFLANFIYLNPLLQKSVKVRIPRYSLGRFANLEDVLKACPDVDRDSATEYMTEKIQEESLVNLRHMYRFDTDFLNKVSDAVRDRAHADHGEILHSCMGVSTPWLKKELPKSVRTSSTNPLKGKIYVTMTTKYETNHLFVQETEDSFGYMPPCFNVRATVAFPPVRENEVWTVGFIQAVTKADDFLHKNNPMDKLV